MKQKKTIGNPFAKLTAKEHKVEDVMARVGVLIKRVAVGIVDLYDAFGERGTSATWVVALFDTSDKKGMQAYHGLMPGWKELPGNGVIAVGCPEDVLLEAAWNAGFTRSADPLGSYVPGCIRVVTFTFGMIVARQVRTVEMDTAGSA